MAGQAGAGIILLRLCWRWLRRLFLHEPLDCIVALIIPRPGADRGPTPILDHPGRNTGRPGCCLSCPAVRGPWPQVSQVAR
jgi:hypothetical protein